MAEEVSTIEAPLAARILRIASPSFRAVAPEVVGRELIPEETFAAMAHAWSQDRFPVRPVTFYRLTNVYVCAEGLVFDEGFRLYRSTIAEHPPEYIDRAVRQLREHGARGAIQTHTGPVLLCKKIGSYNFGHWLIEMLPRALLARQHLKIAEMRFLVHAMEGVMQGVVRDTFTLAGIDRSAVIATPNDPHFFEELYVLDGLAEHGIYMSPLSIEALQQFAAPVRTSPAERIFITRQSARWRRFSNEDELTELAMRAGYSLVDPGAMSLPQQIMIFKGARQIAGISGAGLTNAAFSPPGGKLRVFMPRSMPDTFFWFICQIRKHSYAEQRCHEIGDPPLDGGMRWTWNCDIEIAPDKFRRFIEA